MKELFKDLSLEQKVLNAGIKLLKNKKFVGTFSDRRYIDALTGYRDAVYVDKKELIFMEDLDNIRNALRDCSTISWPAIINEDKKVVIFTALEYGTPFGSYTWQITGLNIFNGEFVIYLKRLKTIEPVDNTLLADFDLADIANATATFLKENLTLQNAKDSTKYIILIVLTLLNVAVELVRLFVVFTNIALFHFPRIMNSLMPILLATVNGVTKCVGGLYILIAMMWRGNAPARMPPKFGELPPSIEGRWTDATITRKPTTKQRNAMMRARPRLIHRTVWPSRAQMM